MGKDGTEGLRVSSILDRVLDRCAESQCAGVSEAVGEVSRERVDQAVRGVAGLDGALAEGQGSRSGARAQSKRKLLYRSDLEVVATYGSHAPPHVPTASQENL